MSDDICRMGLSELAQAIAARQLSAREATEACLARAERLQPVLNTFISLDREGARAAADRVDAALAHGETPGRLAGVPVAHKDMFYRADRVVSCGSRLRRDFRPGYTATALARLDAAGAIDLGGLNMSEFACNPFGLNVLVGRARNPWDPECIAGGSSSGSGAAVAARLVFGSLGSDTGGSVRIPAAVNGVVGLLPTSGRISRYGVMPLSFSLDSAGPLARSVRDCARLAAVVAGHDPLDPGSRSHPVPDWEAEIEGPVAGLRVGVPVRHYWDGASDDVRRALEASVETLRGLGAAIVEVDLPDPAPIDALANTIILSEAAAIHARGLAERGDDYTPIVRSRITFGFSFPATRYVEAVSLRGALLAAYTDTAFAKADVLHVPMLVRPVPRMADIERQLAGKPDLSFNMARNTRLFNYLGMPALSLPCGLSDSGLPVAFQLVGPPYAEGLLFKLGHAYEAAVGGFKAPPERG